MLFNTNMKGKAGEKLVEFDLLVQGIEAFTPSAYGGNQDMLAVVDNKPYKVQIKCGTVVDDCKLRVDVRKSSNVKNRFYSKEDYDVLAIVHVESRRVCYIHREDMTAKNSVNLWLDSASIPSKGKHPSYRHLIFDELLDFPAR